MHLFAIFFNVISNYVRHKLFQFRTKDSRESRITFEKQLWYIFMELWRHTCRTSLYKIYQLLVCIEIGTRDFTGICITAVLLNSKIRNLTLINVLPNFISHCKVVKKLIALLIRGISVVPSPVVYLSTTTLRLKVKIHLLKQTISPLPLSLCCSP